VVDGSVMVIEQDVTDEYALYRGDCVQVMAGIPSDSIHYSIFSPPFASLYTYTDAVEDMGNVQTHSEFYEGFSFAVAELARVLMPGRLVSFHCMNLPSTKERDGFIGIADFRGELIRLFQEHGFIYHSEVCIWKDPLVAMQRTKALGLLHKQIVEDSSRCRQGIPDYLVTMRKPGINPEPVNHKPAGFDRWIGPVEAEPKQKRTGVGGTNGYSHTVWQRYASPVWMDIDPSDTLQRESARTEEDSRHICPLQLTVIRRGIELWTNPGDVVLSPFAGIGSEGYVALEERRRYIGVELKDSYYEQAKRNLHMVIGGRAQETLFGD
jgi:uncharacterized Fe-S cluster protein YjdI